MSRGARGHDPPRPGEQHAEHEHSQPFRLNPPLRSRARSTGAGPRAMWPSFLMLLLAAAPAPESIAQATAGAKAADRANPVTGQSLAPGDQGMAVEDLQRRLNARLEPSPGLDP